MRRAIRPLPLRPIKLAAKSGLCESGEGNEQPDVSIHVPRVLQIKRASLAEHVNLLAKHVSQPVSLRIGVAF